MITDNISLTDQEKEMVVSQSLETEEGRHALAMAMLEPIQTALEYQAIGRRLLMVDHLPQGSYSIYQRDVEASSMMFGKKEPLIYDVKNYKDICSDMQERFKILDL